MMEKIKGRKEIPDVHSKACPAPVSGRWSFVSLFLLKPLAPATVPRKQRRQSQRILGSSSVTNPNAPPQILRGRGASTHHLQAELLELFTDSEVLLVHFSSLIWLVIRVFVFFRWKLNIMNSRTKFCTYFRQ